MELKELLQFIKHAEATIEKNNIEINKSRLRQEKLSKQNELLQKEMQAAKKVLYEKKFLQVNISEVFIKMCKALENYEGVLSFRIHKSVKLSNKDLPKIKNFLKEKNIQIRLSFNNYSKLYTNRDFCLEYPLKDIVLTSGKKLIDNLIVEDNCVVVPKEFESKIMLNISLDDKAMNDSLFKECVFKCLEKSLAKENGTEKN